MGTLADALAKAGVITHQQARCVDLEVDLNAPKPERVATLDDLNGVSTVREFKARAKDILMRDPNSLRAVLDRAHQLPKDVEGRKRLIALLYAMRDDLECLSEEDRVQYVRKTLRRGGAQKPTSWRK